MAVDLLRSCYSTKMRFFSERPDVETLVHWYFCEPGAKILPYRTVFNSGNWWSDKNPDITLGEIPGSPRPWRNGQPPAPYAGQAPCGTDREFLFGVPNPPVPPIEQLPNGMPVFAAPETAGLLYFGTAEVTLIANEIQARRATTMDIYRTGTAPPAAPAVAAVPILIEADFHIRGEAGEGDAAVGHYSHTALVQFPAVDIRDDYNEGTRGANYDTVWVPNAAGTRMVVRFVEVIALEGSAALYQRVYLDRGVPVWPRADV